MALGVAPARDHLTVCGNQAGVAWGEGLRHSSALGGVEKEKGARLRPLAPQHLGMCLLQAGSCSHLPI